MLLLHVKVCLRVANILCELVKTVIGVFKFYLVSFFTTSNIIEIVYSLALRIFLFLLHKTLISFYLIIFLFFYIIVALILPISNLDQFIQNIVLTCYFFAYLIAFFFVTIIIFSKNDITAFKFFIGFISSIKSMKLSKTSYYTNQKLFKDGVAYSIYIKILSNCSPG